MAIIVKMPDGSSRTFEDGTPPDSIRKALASAPPAPQAAPPAATERKRPKIPQLMYPGSHPLLGILETQPENLPMMMAAPGGFVPGPLGWGLSAAGGGIGEAIRQPLMGEPTDIGRIGRVAGTQAALGAAGGLISKPLSWIGQRTLATAVGASSKAKMKVAQAMGRKEGRVVGPVEGSIGKVMAKERVGVREKDWKRLRDEVSSLTAKADDLARKAGAEGYKFTVDDFMEPLKKMRSELKSEFDAIPELRRFDKMVQRFEKQHTTKGIGPTAPGVAAPQRIRKELTPKQVLELRRQWDRTANAIYERAASGVGGGPMQGMRAEAAAAVAGGARKALHGMGQTGKELAAVTQRQSELIPLRDAILRGLLMNSGASPPFISPVLAQMMMPQVLRSRTTLSALGLGMTDPTMLGMARNIPRVLGNEGGLPEILESQFNSGALPDSLNRR